MATVKKIGGGKDEQVNTGDVQGSETTLYATISGGYIS